jgi:hypothetical protein
MMPDFARLSWRKARKTKNGDSADTRSYIADANAQRKYEDGKALQEALNEIRAEIGSITSRM